MHVLFLKIFFPIHNFLQMHKEHLATIPSYCRSNVRVNVKPWSNTFLTLTRIGQIVGHRNGTVLEIGDFTFNPFLSNLW